jgi:hypothetical protein
MDSLTACPWCSVTPSVIVIPVGFRKRPPRMVSCENQACPVAPATDAFDTEEQAVAAWNRWLDTARAVLAEVDKEAKREG